MKSSLSTFWSISKDMTKLRKAVFPVAGLGSRFLPVTKASPKEMLPVVDKPLIQYAVEEAAAAGITEMVFVTGRNKRAIEDHFDKAYELETELERKGKVELLAMVRSVLPDGVRCIYIRQAEPLGLGHAVLCAQPIVGNEPFAVILADDLMDSQPPAMERMARIYETERSSLLGVEEVPRDQTQNYGIVTVDPMEGDTARIHSIIEKPKPAVAPSNLAVIGRYVLTPRIFELLAQVTPGAGGEMQLTDAISALLVYERVLAVRLPGKRFDCGSKLGYLEATVELGLRHPEIGKDFARFLKNR
jgi:UTP--glucose-1-phosphate uridylyltransferase